LVAAFLPDIPHAVLLLIGLQGTGKSSAARLLVTLVDPSAAPLRGEPHDLDQWQVAASGSWVVVIDNLSSIRPWLSDAICRAVTGEGAVRRRLYSDSDLTVLSFRRVVVITSIDAGVLRGDLGERLLLVDLEQIPEAGRRTEREIDAQFFEKRPRLFAACLDALAAVLAKLPDVRPEQLPRMADFGRVLAATDAAGITSGALERFRRQQSRIAGEVIDADSFGTALVELARRGNRWQGTATELLAELLPDGEKPPHDWPKSNGVAGRIKRLAPALASHGVHAHVPKERSNRGRIITVEVSGDGSSLSSQPSPTTPAQAVPSDDGDDVSRIVSSGGDVDAGGSLIQLPWPEESEEDRDSLELQIEPVSDADWNDTWGPNVEGPHNPTPWCPYGHPRGWRSIHGGNPRCATCHPPATPEIVARWVEIDQPPA
jgi:hypothetical protein